MKRSVIVALSAAVIAMLAASSAAVAATIDFGVNSIDGSITFLGGSSLDQSTTLDLDLAFLAANEISPSDESGLALNNVISLTTSGPIPAEQTDYLCVQAWTA